MKQIHTELAVFAAAAVACVFLAVGSSRAENTYAASVSQMKTEAQEATLDTAASEESIPEPELTEQEKAAAEKAAEEERKAKEEAEKKAKEEAERKAAEEAKAKAEAEAQEKAKKEAAEMAALGLCPNPRIRVSAEELDLLAALIHCEAGGEEMTGRIAVGAVVLNRVQSDVYENSIRDVIYAPGQFTPAMTGLLDQTLAAGVDEDCYAAARAALNGDNPIGDCLYFNCGYGQGIQIGYQHFY